MKFTMMLACAAAALAALSSPVDAFLAGGATSIRRRQGQAGNGAHLAYEADEAQHQSGGGDYAHFRQSAMLAKKNKKKDRFPQVQERWFNAAVLDHFSPTKETWRQRYFINDEYWGGEGYPIFLQIGGEGPMSKPDASSLLYMGELGQQHKALLIAVEHRFYGMSWPTKDMSNANLRYLHSEQALSDLVVFHEMMSAQKKYASSPWVSFGGSYPGTLAAWHRLKFPHLTLGAVASSAPVNTKVDFFGYMDVVGHSLHYYGGDQCVQNVRAGADAVAELMKTKSGRDHAKRVFNLCDAPVTPDDVKTLYGDLMGNVQGVVQYNNEHVGRPTITHLCAIAANATSPLDVMVQLNAAFGAGAEKECTDISYKGAVAELSNSTFAQDGSQNARQWTFQTCNQFGMFQTAEASEPFAAFAALDTAYYLQLCRDVFGIDRRPFAEFSNNYYGALKIGGTNIIFPNGNIDPWHALGVVNTTSLAQSPSEHAVFIDGGAHCSDMFHTNPKHDTMALTKAHTKISSSVALWLAEYADQLANGSIQ